MNAAETNQREAVANPEALVRAVDAARRGAEELGDHSRAALRQYATAFEAFHAESLRRIVRALKSDPRGKEILFSLVEDPLVYAAMLDLGVVRADVTTRVAKAIETVRPYAQSHGGDVEFDRVEEGVAYVRMKGACSGCSMSSQTLTESVESAVKKAAPEIERVQAIESPKAGGGFVQLTVGAGAESGPPSAEHGWARGPLAADLVEGRTMRVLLDGADVLLVRKAGVARAYRNSCPHQGLPLDEGPLDESGTLTCPWHGFEFDVCTGECANEPAVQLEPFPLTEWEGVIHVRVGGGPR